MMGVAALGSTVVIIDVRLCILYGGQLGELLAQRILHRYDVMAGSFLEWLGIKKDEPSNNDSSLAVACDVPRSMRSTVGPSSGEYA